jgi:hypothetical protein
MVQYSGSREISRVTRRFTICGGVNALRIASTDILQSHNQERHLSERFQTLPPQVQEWTTSKSCDACCERSNADARRQKAASKKSNADAGRQKAAPKKRNDYAKRNNAYARRQKAEPKKSDDYAKKPKN